MFSKKMWDKIVDLFLYLFMIYSFIAVWWVSIQLLNNAFITLIIITIFAYGYIKKYEKEQNKIKDYVSVCNNVHLLDYSNLKNIMNISISTEKSFVYLKNGGIREIKENQIPKNQDELIKLDEDI